MFKGLQKQLFPVWAWALLFMGILGAATVQAATTPAGTLIKNQAVVTYQDVLGNSKEVKSNESVVTVAEVYSADLKDTQTKDGAPGQMVYFPHQLTNNGNTVDEFTLETADVHDDLKDVKIFHDLNGNGQPDAGEPEIAKVKVARGATENLIVAARAPVGASTNDEFKLTLKATSTNNSFAGNPSKENEDTVKISDGAILAFTKTVVNHDRLNGEVTYQIRMINNGADLKEGAVYDFFPKYLDISKLNGQVINDTRLGDIKLEDAKTLKDELPASGVKYLAENDHAQGIRVPVTNLKGGDTASFTFTVEYTTNSGTDEAPVYGFEAGTELRNKALIGFGVKDNGRWKKHGETNTVVEALPSVVYLTAKDRTDMIQIDTVDSAVEGGEAEFINIITNLGNGKDSFDLSMENQSFPQGTTFEFYNHDTGAPLTNGAAGLPNTGSVNSAWDAANNKGSNKFKVRIIAKLPAGYSGDNGGKGYEAKMTATSVADRAKSDKVSELLKNITQGGMDLANYNSDTTNKDIDFRGDVIEVDDFFKKDAKDNYHPKNDITSVISRKPKQVAEFGLFIANKANLSSSFALSSTVTKSPGWKVTYYDHGIFDKDGKEIRGATGQQITTTPALPKQSVMKVLAKVEVPESATAAVYGLDFTATSNANGQSDTTTNQIKVVESALLAFSPPGNQSIEAGGVAKHQHVLENKGNVNLSVIISSKTVLKGWNYRLKDKDDKLIPAGTAIPLSKGESKNITVEVSAPANAPGGDVLNLELVAEDAKVGNAKASLIDKTTVISSQLSLVKKVKVLKGKGKTEDQIKTEAQALEAAEFEVNGTEAIPGEDYAVWQVIATNKGSDDAKGVIVVDAAPEFTELVNGSAIVKEGEGVVADGITGAKIQFNVGEAATTGKDGGGKLSPGQFTEVRFVVKIK